MRAEHRYVAAFVAASLHADRVFTHVHDHDAGREFAMGGIVRPDGVDLIEGGARARISGAPDRLFHHGTGAYIHLALGPEGFSGYDYESEKHFSGLFAGEAVQLFDHETGRYHNFHIS